MNRLISLFIIFLVACSTENTSKVDSNYCTNSASCLDGELCRDNICIVSDCITSQDCSLEQYCDSNYTCESGCLEDTDCLSGRSCNQETLSCEPQTCRTTELDCMIGEYCNTVSGQCEPDTFNHCGTDCTLNELFGLADQPGECLIWEINFDVTCSDTTNGTGCPNPQQICVPESALSGGNPFGFGGVCVDTYRFDTCIPAEVDACPRGFTCTEINFSDGGTINVCAGDCPFYLGEGYLN